jgi:hypothetical protein
MPRPRSRKVRYLPRTSSAVHAAHPVHAQPKRSTPFTHLQIHTQARHLFLLGPDSGVVLPRRASIIFLRSKGLAQAAMKCRCNPRRALTGSIDVASHLSIASQADEHGTKAIHPPSLPGRDQPKITSYPVISDPPLHGRKSQGYISAQNWSQREFFPSWVLLLSILFHYV